MKRWTKRSGAWPLSPLGRAAAPDVSTHASLPQQTSPCRDGRDPRYPSLYQLFPHEGAAVVWDNGPGGRLRPHDLFADRDLAGRLGLSQDNLDAAARLHEVLRGPQSGVRTFMFIGTRYETVTHFLHDGRSLRLVRTTAAGDGTVPLQGAILENHEIRFPSRNAFHFDTNPRFARTADRTRRTIPLPPGRRDAAFR